MAETKDPTFQLRARRTLPNQGVYASLASYSMSSSQAPSKSLKETLTRLSVFMNKRCTRRNMPQNLQLHVIFTLRGGSILPGGMSVHVHDVQFSSILFHPARLAFALQARGALRQPSCNRLSLQLARQACEHSFRENVLQKQWQAFGVKHQMRMTHRH